MASFASWIQAARLRTLPLAFASICMGAFLAAEAGKFNPLVFACTLLTTLLLQILSNYANDYGDFVNGADLTGRQGPARMLQSGAISQHAMKKALYLVSVLTFTSGILLLYLSGLLENISAFGFFLALGIAAIVAALKYTAGSNPYGYMGLGDLSVLMFFGWTGVMGTFYLMTQSISFVLFLPATAFGLLATGVLNVNNMRDIDSDQKAGKNTIPVRIGLKQAKSYHALLIGCAFLMAALYLLSTKNTHIGNACFLLSLPLFLFHLQKVQQANSPQQLDPLLKQLALSSFVFVITFGIGLLLA